MTDNIVDFSEYKVKLEQIRTGAEQETEESKRDLILALCNWFKLKVDDWEKKRQEYGLTVKELDFSNSDSTREQEIMLNYLSHLRLFGRLMYVFHGINIINSEGDGWENDSTSTKAVLDMVLTNF